jgi:mono/diheme cytochrome c family protein
MSRALRVAAVSAMLVNGLFVDVAPGADDSSRTAWAAFPLPDAHDASPGRRLFWNHCAACHGEGAGMPGTAALAAKYGGQKPAPLEQRTDLTADFVTSVVRHGVSVMPMFRKTELSDADLAVLAAYLAQR